MISVLIVAVSKPAIEVLDEAVAELTRAGARVSFVVSVQASRLLGKRENAHVVKERVAELPSTVRGGESTNRAQRFWNDLRLDPWVAARARSADVIVALDFSAVYSVWELVQRHREVNAQFGLAPAKRAVAALTAEARHQTFSDRFRRLPRVTDLALWIRRSVARTVELFWRTVTSRRVMESRIRGRRWLRAGLVRMPMSERRRAEIGYRAARSLIQGRDNKGAAILIAAYAERIDSLVLKAELHAAISRESIARGAMPPGLVSAFTSLLNAAGEEFESGDVSRAGELLVQASELIFSVPVHFHRGNSPLAMDPATYLKPLFASKIGALLSAPGGRQLTAAAPPVNRPLRLLIATRANANFLTEIIDHFESRADVEVRFLDTSTDPELSDVDGQLSLVAARLGCGPETIDVVERRLRPHLDWADVVFVDWMAHLAAMFTLIDPGNTRIIVRLHSFEMFRLWPHLVDLSRVDDLVFVSKHFKAFAGEVLPTLSLEDAPVQQVVFNAMKLNGYSTEKAEGARFVVALVGYGQIAKDPRWALRVVELLRAQDQRYRLLLVGSPSADLSSVWARTYKRKLDIEIARLEAADGIEVYGHCDDVPDLLKRVGVILSSSVRESFHIALVEGAASGAVPIVRDWPFFADHKHGAASVFPREWVVQSPEQAVARILDTTRDDETWCSTGAAARRYVLENFDWEVVKPDYDRLILSADRAGD